MQIHRKGDKYSSPYCTESSPLPSPLTYRKDSHPMAAETGRLNEPIKQTQRVAACPSSTGSLRGFFSCERRRAGEVRKSRRKRMGCSGSFCRSKDLQRPEASLPEPCKRRASVSGRTATERSRKMPLTEINNAVSTSLASVAVSPASVAVSSSSSPLGGSFRGMNLGRLSGCYECHMVVDPINGTPRYSSVRATISSCPDCGEIFMKADSLELHQAVRHAGSVCLVEFLHFCIDQVALPLIVPS